MTTRRTRSLVAGAVLVVGASIGYGENMRAPVSTKRAAAIVRAACSADTRATIAIEIAPPDVFYRDGKLVAEFGRAIELGGGVRLYEDQHTEDARVLPQLTMSPDRGATMSQLRYQGKVAARLWLRLAPCAGQAARVDLTYTPLALEFFDLSTTEGRQRQRAALTFEASDARTQGFVPAAR